MIDRQDRESHTHAAGFGGEEGGEQPVRILGGDPDAAIRHTYQPLVVSRPDAIGTTSSRGRSVTIASIQCHSITRLMITCCSWTRSPRIMGRVGANSIRTIPDGLINSRVPTGWSPSQRH